MNRFGAFAVHLGISLVIFAILGYIIVFQWYPDFFFASDGGWQGIRIVALVDLVLGPTLTLVVYKKGKPSLRFDLTVIALIQFVSLTAGVYVVFSERPIAMIFSNGSFTSMTADDYLQANQPVPDLSEFPGSPPVWISVILPDEPSRQAAIREQAFASRSPISTLAQYYVSFDVKHIDTSRDGLSKKELEGLDEPSPFLQEFFREHGGEFDDYLFLSFGTRYRLALIAMRRTDRSLTYLHIPAAGLAR